MKKIHNIIKTINERFNKINFYGHTYLSEGDRFLYIMFHSELTDLKTYNSFYIKLLKEALKDKYNNLNECNITNLKSLEENDNYFFCAGNIYSNLLFIHPAGIGKCIRGELFPFNRNKAGWWKWS